MISNPRIGMVVQVWYRAQLRGFMPLHGVVATVRVRARGPGPRNHGVEHEGRLYVVPAGNLRPARPE